MNKLKQIWKKLSGVLWPAKAGKEAAAEKPSPKPRRDQGKPPIVSKSIFFVKDQFVPLQLIGDARSCDSGFETAEDLLKDMAEKAATGRILLEKQIGERPVWLFVEALVSTAGRVDTVGVKFSFKDLEGGKFRPGICRHEDARLKDLDRRLKRFLN